MASFDLGNPNEAEAMNAARALRRMVEAAGSRFVDVMELDEVKQALDDQMKPVRKVSPELQEARQEASALRQELTERTRDVRELAELLTRERARAGKQANAGPCPRFRLRHGERRRDRGGGADGGCAAADIGVSPREFARKGGPQCGTGKR